MKKKISARLGTALTILLFFYIAGCADSQTTSHSEENWEMNGKGRGMRQESPPDNVNNRENQFLPEQDFTEDAFLACQGKKEGDSTMVHNDHNETVKATCQIINDHLVAVVKKTTEPEDRRPPLRR